MDTFYDGVRASLTIFCTKSWKSGNLSKISYVDFVLQKIPDFHVSIFLFWEEFRISLILFLLFQQKFIVQFPMSIFYLSWNNENNAMEVCFTMNSGPP